MNHLGDPVFDILVDKMAADLDVDVELVESVARSDEAEREESNPKKLRDNSPLEVAEFDAIVASERRENHRKDWFIKSDSGLKAWLDERADPESFENEIADRLDVVKIIHRLRSVRALTAFSRITRDRDHAVPVDIDGKARWRPAIEVFGEGVFIALNAKEIEHWASRKAVQERVQKVTTRFHSLDSQVRTSYRGTSSFAPSAKFLLLHTLSHLLMLQMQFTSGYSTSSIRERLYCDFEDGMPPMSGILLYTSSGDAEGSMGGLARLGWPQNLLPTFLAAIRNASTCSNDPVCIESPGQGLDGLNRAACHACGLVPETSCTFRNQFLDRALVSGTHSNPSVGFFSDIAERIEL